MQKVWLVYQYCGRPHEADEWLRSVWSNGTAAYRERKRLQDIEGGVDAFGVEEMELDVSDAEHECDEDE